MDSFFTLCKELIYLRHILKVVSKDVMLFYAFALSDSLAQKQQNFSILRLRKGLMDRHTVYCSSGEGT